MDDRRSGNAPPTDIATQVAASVADSSVERTSSPSSETQRSGDLAADDRRSADKPVAGKSRLRKVWKWFTGTPSRKALSAFSALLLAAISGIVGTVAGAFLETAPTGPLNATQDDCLYSSDSQTDVLSVQASTFLLM